MEIIHRLNQVIMLINASCSLIGSEHFGSLVTRNLSDIAFYQGIGNQNISSAKTRAFGHSLYMIHKILFVKKRRSKAFEHAKGPPRVQGRALVGNVFGLGRTP